VTPLLLALRFLNAHRVRTTLLMACFAIVFLVPITSRVVLSSFGDRWMRRATDTPLVLGPRGSAFDLALKATWFRGDSPGEIAVSDWSSIRDTGYARSYPLNLRNNAQGHPLVGTTIDYLEWRGLRPGSGRFFAQIGECVLGSNVADALQLQVGGSILTDPPHSFSLASSYPLQMDVVGVLQPTGTPDDHAVFVDLKTAWIAEGIGHGHDDLRALDQPDAILENRDGTIIGSPSVLQFNRITPQNRSTFHFHGDESAFPLSAVILVPHDQRSEALLLGRYISRSATRQMIRPAEALDKVLNTILQVQSLFDLAFVLLLTITALFLGLIIFLTLKVRHEEMMVFRRMGASRRLIALIQIVEYAVPAMLGLLLALLAARIVMSHGESIVDVLFLWRFS
jgi:putative ABC transport system permease protein